MSHLFRLQGILKTTVSGVFGDLKFKISEGSDQTVSGVFEDLNFKFSEGSDQN